MSGVNTHCDECMGSEHHQQMTNEVYPDNPSVNTSFHHDKSVNQKQKNPLVWGDDILFLDQEHHDHDTVANDQIAGTSCFSRSSEVRDEDTKANLRHERQQQSNKVILTETDIAVSLSDITGLNSMEQEKFIGLAGFSFFPTTKDEATEDMNDICSSLQIDTIHESHPCSVEELNSVRISPVPEEPTPTGRSGLRRARNPSRRISVVNGDDYCGQSESNDNTIRKRNMSEHSVMSAGSYDDPDSPYTSSGRKKRRRYEEEPSDDPAFEKSRKNAIIAKRNREKKKQMMEQMESRCDKLSSQNELLDSDNTKLRHRVQVLEEEVFYLKSLLANDSALSNVLSNLKQVDNLRLSSSFEASKFNKRSGSSSGSHSRFSSAPANGQLKVSGGICLHVIDGNQVSLELCAKCAQVVCNFVIKLIDLIFIF